jgi:hypothetical protein
VITHPRVWMVCSEHTVSADELQFMLDNSALYTRELGFNRRYHHWLFDIREGQCYNMRMCSRIEPEPVYVGKPGSGGFMEEEHLDCDGEGCSGCGGIGRVRRWL